MSACLAVIQACNSRQPVRQQLQRSRQAAGGRRQCAAVAAAAAGSRQGAPPGATSLVPETLEQLAADEELQQLHARIAEVGQVRCRRAEHSSERCWLELGGAVPALLCCQSEPPA